MYWLDHFFFGSEADSQCVESISNRSKREPQALSCVTQMSWFWCWKESPYCGFLMNWSLVFGQKNFILVRHSLGHSPKSKKSWWPTETFLFWNKTVPLADDRDPLLLQMWCYSGRIKLRSLGRSPNHHTALHLVALESYVTQDNKPVRLCCAYCQRRGNRTRHNNRTRQNSLLASMWCVGMQWGVSHHDGFWYKG
jgi:hypothetical protein